MPDFLRHSQAVRQRPPPGAPAPRRRGPAGKPFESAALPQLITSPARLGGCYRRTVTGCHDYAMLTVLAGPRQAVLGLSPYIRSSSGSTAGRMTRASPAGRRS